MKKCVIIYNPQSGRIRKKRDLQTVYDLLRKYGYDTEIKYTKRKKDAIQMVKSLDNDIDLVISAGGDGTLNEVVSGNLEREKRLILANLPMGTTNDVGSMYGLTKNYIKNLEMLLDGVKKKIDVCFINETPFVYVACLGDYIDMAYNTPRDLKKKYGKIAYVLYGIKQLRNKIHSYNIKYTIDNETFTGEYSFFFITNASRVAGMNDIYYDIKLDDNMFEVAFCNLKTKAEMMKMFFLINNMDVKDIPGITYYQTDNIEIEFLDSLKTSWCIDGEEYKTAKTKFKFKVDKHTKMLMPKENLIKLFTEEE